MGLEVSLYIKCGLQQHEQKSARGRDKHENEGDVSVGSMGWKGSGYIVGCGTAAASVFARLAEGGNPADVLAPAPVEESWPPFGDNVPPSPRPRRADLVCGGSDLALGAAAIDPASPPAGDRCGADDGGCSAKNAEGESAESADCALCSAVSDAASAEESAADACCAVAADAAAA